MGMPNEKKEVLGRQRAVMGGRRTRNRLGDRQLRFVMVPIAWLVSHR